MGRGFGSKRGLIFTTETQSHRVYPGLRGVIVLTGA